MDPHENTTEKKPGQAQSPELQDSANQAEEPGNMKAESPRKCNICGGPNHYGCGCEARQKQAAVQVETENIKPAETQTQDADLDAEKEAAAIKKLDEDIEAFLTPEAIKESHFANLKMAKDIETMNGSIEGLCACFYDTNNYLKVIAGDLITIRKILSKEDEKTEPENAG